MNSRASRTTGPYPHLSHMHITALLTCFNRRELTLRCITSLKALDRPNGTCLSVVLVDDNSCDGTADAVKGILPDVEVLRGTGCLYWCGGMRKAWQHAAQSDPDYYLLVNDDTLIEKCALTELCNIVGSPSSKIIGVGAIRDPDTGAPTYGGLQGIRGSKLLAPTGRPESCTTLNANLVLIPRKVFQEMGVFHEAYTHGLGDYDYGFQAAKRGIQIIQTPEFVGACKTNSITGTFLDRSLCRTERWKLVQSPKGLPFRPWLTFNRRNSGWLWPYRVITPYLRILLGL